MASVRECQRVIGTMRALGLGREIAPRELLEIRTRVDEVLTTNFSLIPHPYGGMKTIEAKAYTVESTRTPRSQELAVLDYGGTVVAPNKPLLRVAFRKSSLQGDLMTTMDGLLGDYAIRDYVPARGSDEANEWGKNFLEGTVVYTLKPAPRRSERVLSQETTVILSV